MGLILYLKLDTVLLLLPSMATWQNSWYYSTFIKAKMIKFMQWDNRWAVIERQIQVTVHTVRADYMLQQSGDPGDGV